MMTLKDKKLTAFLVAAMIISVIALIFLMYAYSRTLQLNTQMYHYPDMTMVQDEAIDKIIFPAFNNENLLYEKKIFNYKTARALIGKTLDIDSIRNDYEFNFIHVTFNNMYIIYNNYGNAHLALYIENDIVTGLTDTYLSRADLADIYMRGFYNGEIKRLDKFLNNIGPVSVNRVYDNTYHITSCDKDNHIFIASVNTDQPIMTLTDLISNKDGNSQYILVYLSIFMDKQSYDTNMLNMDR